MRPGTACCRGVGSKIEPGDLPRVFRGSDVVRAGLLTRGQLRGPAVKRLFSDVFAPVSVRDTHELRCEGAALFLPSIVDLLVSRTLPDAVADLDAVLRRGLLPLA